MIARFVVKIALLFAVAGLFLSAVANLLSGRSFALDIQSWSLALSIFLIGFGITVVSLCFFALREWLSAQRRR